MAQIIGLPKLSPTMEEGVLVKWIKNEGEAIEPGDLVAEVETDKANMDFTLEDEGVLLKQLVAEGDTVQLGAPVAILGDMGEDITALIEEARSNLDARNNQPAAPSIAAVPPPPAASVPAGKPASSEMADTQPFERQKVVAPRGQRLLASPLAKTLAIELGIDLRQVEGSGPGGRIVERDVRGFVDGDRAQPLAPPLPQSATLPAVVKTATHETALALPAGDYTDEPLSGIRRTIAERLTAAKRDIPHYTLTRDFDASPLLAFRSRLNELLGDAGRVSVNDMLIKAAALALRDVPEVNASFQGDSIRRYHRVHIGVAVATERGLMTPVVRDADLKGIGGIGREVKSLVQRAADRQLKVDEIQGSTLTISNLGMFGIHQFDAIINPPEAAILAVSGIREVPVVDDGNVVPGKRMNITMSCDHRVIDGATGARYLGALISLLEKPEALAL